MFGGGRNTGRNGGIGGIIGNAAQTIVDKVITTVNTVRNTTRNIFNRATGKHGAVVTSTVDNVAQATGGISNVLSGGNAGGIRMKNIIEIHMSLKSSVKILLLAIIFMCCISGCGEKGIAEGHVLSVLVCKKLDYSADVPSKITLMPEMDMEEINIRSISENDFEDVEEENFRIILKGLFKKYSNDYEIYATDNPNYALVVYWYGGKPSALYWFYKENEKWHIEIPDTFLDMGHVENVEFHKLDGLGKEILIVQDANNQGHGDTFIFQILNNSPQCVGYVRRSVDRSWGEPMNATEIELYAGKGNLQVAFQDIDNDGFEEMLVYGRKLIYDVESVDEEES